MMQPIKEIPRRFVADVAMLHPSSGRSTQWSACDRCHHRVVTCAQNLRPDAFHPFGFQQFLTRSHHAQFAGDALRFGGHPRRSIAGMALFLSSWLPSQKAVPNDDSYLLPGYYSAPMLSRKPLRLAPIRWNSLTAYSNAARPTKERLEERLGEAESKRSCAEQRGLLARGQEGERHRELRCFGFRERFSTSFKSAPLLISTP